MAFLNELCRRSALGCLVITLASFPSTSHASDPVWTVERLMALLREQRKPSVVFEETTYSSVLTEPLKSRGVLRFTPPATLEKLVTDPFHERYVIQGDRVTYESRRKGVTRTLLLDEYPALRSFVEAFRMSLMGEAAQLKQLYEVTLDGSPGKWTLLLRPLDPGGKSLVDYLLFTGSDGRIATIAVRSPDGDRSVMTLLWGASR
jgi:hypothetical protein